MNLMKSFHCPAFWLLSFGFHALFIVIAALLSIVIEMPEDDERDFVPMVSDIELLKRCELHSVALVLVDDDGGVSSDDNLGVGSTENLEARKCKCKPWRNCNCGDYCGCEPPDHF